MQVPTIPGAIAHPESHEPIRFLARLGYAVKGVVYGVMGVLALRVGLGDGGRLAGEHEAVREVHRHPFGDVALVVIGAGLACYAIWRFIEAAFDPYRVGRSLRGVAARVAALASAIANGAVALMALELAADESESRTSPKSLAVSVLREDWGPALLAAVGAGIAGVGIFHVVAAFTDRFCEHLDLRGRSRRLRRYVFWSGRLGFLARGILFAIIGVAALRAGLRLDPSEVKDFREALRTLLEQPFGPALLVGAAVGLLAYGLHLVATAPIRKLAS